VVKEGFGRAYHTTVWWQSSEEDEFILPGLYGAAGISGNFAVVRTPPWPADASDRGVVGDLQRFVRGVRSEVVTLLNAPRGGKKERYAAFVKIASRVFSGHI